MALRAHGPNERHIEMFFSWLLGRRQVTRSTATDYVRNLHRVARYSGVSPTDIRFIHIETYLSDPEKKWNTKNLALISVRMFHRWGAVRGYWELDPDLLEIRLRKNRPAAKEGLTLAEARALMAHADTPVRRRLVYPGLFAGLRTSENADLLPSRWTLGVGGVEMLTIADSKFGKTRKIPVHAALTARREELLATIVTEKVLRKTAREMREDIGRDDLTPQLLRVTFGQTMSDCGTERPVIGEILGHAQTSVTVTNYVPIRLSEQVVAMRTLDYGVDQGTLF